MFCKCKTAFKTRFVILLLFDEQTYKKGQLFILTKILIPTNPGSAQTNLGLGVGHDLSEKERGTES